MPTAPFPPSAGQAVAIAYPTQAIASGPIFNTFHTAQDGYGEAGVDDNGNQYGFAQMWHSCGLCDWISYAQWQKFVAPDLPLNAGGVVGIYAVADAKAYDLDVYNISYSMKGANFIMNPDLLNPGGVAMNGPPGNLGGNFDETPFTTVWTTSSLGIDLTLLSTYSIFCRFFQSLAMSTAHKPTIYFQNPRLAIYYAAPVMPIGHACNANAYGPITLADGSTTPPGNGILIDI